MEDELHELLTLPEAAALAGVSHSTIYKRVAEGRFPKPLRLGRTVRWSEAQVREWLGRDADMLSTRDVMDYLQVSRMTVRAMVSDGRLPRPERVGNADFWHSEELEALASISRPAGSRPEVVAVDAGASVATDRNGHLVQYRAGALTPGDVETPPTLRDVGRGPVAQLKERLAEAVELAEYLQDNEEVDALRATLETRGLPISAEPDPERMERLRQQVVLRSQGMEDYLELRHEERVAGVQRYHVQVDIVKEPDGAEDLDFRYGEEHRAALTAALVLKMPEEDFLALVQERFGSDDRAGGHRGGEVVALLAAITAPLGD